MDGLRTVPKLRMSECVEERSSVEMVEVPTDQGEGRIVGYIGLAIFFALRDLGIANRDRKSDRLWADSKTVDLRRRSSHSEAFRVVSESSADLESIARSVAVPKWTFEIVDISNTIKDA